MNLDLGGVIWLDVTRKLLSFHKWFFKDWNKRPKEVKTEFQHHSHTHPNKEFTTGNSTQGAHSAPVTSMVNCGSTPTRNRHAHTIAFQTEAPHNHSFTLGFAPADLGSPWYNHTHDFVTVSCGDGGVPHVHSVYSPSLYAACGNCFPSGHTHICTGVSVNSSGVTHNDHVAPLDDTFTAEQDGTPASHRHLIRSGVFGLSVSNAANHGHTTSGNPNNAVCALFFNHGHTVLTGLGAASHNHVITDTGYTDYDGEEPPSVKVGYIDGLVCIA